MTIIKCSWKLLQYPYKLNRKVSGRTCTTCSRKELPAAAYQPRLVEAKWQEKQQQQQQKTSCQTKRGTFRMLLPPPNVTGNLHLGHALMATVQDVICRQKRQLGYDVVWVPGTDHAGIATQVVVEKKLLKEKGLSRQELGRKDFLAEVWKWKEEKEGSIVDDLKKLGCTLSWDKEYFTMDAQRAHAVNVAFIKLFDEGLIERRKALVNWSCALESAISDIEVDTLEVKGPTELAVPGYRQNITFGRLYDISYRICDSDESIVVSTTRPETLLGDVAVAVHPEDERYVKYRNSHAVDLWHPFRREKIPLIFDVKVEPDFGTGAVKITPAHDKNDFEMATRHLLEAIPVFCERGKILDDFEHFKQMPRFEARERILEQLAEKQLLGNISEHTMTIPICSRSKDVIEYMLRPQWFLRSQELAEAAISEVQSGRLQLVPPNFEIEWHRWLENCHDWCISRQLWWGHQIPAYLATDVQGNTCWLAALNEIEALEKAQTQLAAKVVHVQQDADVLDTWFSSSLLPFSAFGWPAGDYKAHYPLDLMETGHDILFFWVARMVMLGLKLTGEVPFKKVLLNGIVCDAHGRKMSKSLGNVVTPQQVVQGATKQSLQADIQKMHDSGMLSNAELKKSLKGLQKMFPNGIQECGTDALRFTLCSHNIKSHFINFDVAECHTNKLFFNKIWQATRYTLSAADRLNLPLHEIESMNNVELSKWNLWILSRLADTLKVCAESFESYNLHAATAALKQFFYNNLCDVYLETTKTNINTGTASGYIDCATLATCLSWALQAMSPFTPFLAAELLQHLPQNVQLNLSKFHNSAIEAEIEEILQICQSIRQLKSRNKISKKHEPKVYLYAQTPEAFNIIKTHLEAMQTLTLTVEMNLEMKSPDEQQNKKIDFYSTAGHLCAFGIKTNDSFGHNTKKLTKVDDLNEKKLLKLQAELERYRTRLENAGFRKSASEQVQKQHFERMQQLEVEIQNIQALSS